MLLHRSPPFPIHVRLSYLPDYIFIVVFYFIFITKSKPVVLYFISHPPRPSQKRFLVGRKNRKSSVNFKVVLIVFNNLLSSRRRVVQSQMDSTYNIIICNRQKFTPVIRKADRIVCGSFLKKTLRIRSPQTQQMAISKLYLVTLHTCRLFENCLYCLLSQKLRTYFVISCQKF